MKAEWLASDPSVSVCPLKGSSASACELWSLSCESELCSLSLSLSSLHWRKWSPLIPADTGLQLSIWKRNDLHSFLLRIESTPHQPVITRYDSRVSECIRVLHFFFLLIPSPSDRIQAAWSLMTSYVWEWKLGLGSLTGKTVTSRVQECWD